MPNTITITTTNKALWFDLHDLSIEGVSHVPQLEYKDAPNGKPVYKIVLRIASDLAIGLLCTWLLQQIEGHTEGETKIENQRVPHDRTQITNIIRKKVVIQHFHREKSPDDERIPEE